MCPWKIALPHVSTEQRYKRVYLMLVLHMRIVQPLLLVVRCCCVHTAHQCIQSNNGNRRQATISYRSPCASGRSNSLSCRRSNTNVVATAPINTVTSSMSITAMKSFAARLPVSSSSARTTATVTVYMKTPILRLRMALLGLRLQNKVVTYGFIIPYTARANHVKPAETSVSITAMKSFAARLPVSSSNARTAATVTVYMKTPILRLRMALLGFRLQIKK